MSTSLVQNMPLFIARILGLLVAIPIHEVSHAYVSYKLGDPTAKQLGRLSLNPVKHFDPLGLMAMLIIGVGWAKPVPVDPRFYKDRKKGMAITALAGPLSNILLALVSMIVYKLIFYISVSAGASVQSGPVMYIVLVLQFFTWINVSLALFNLLPIPPLDGSRIVGVVLPDKLYDDLQRIERYIMFGLLAVMFLLPRLTGINLFGWLLSDLVGMVVNGLDWLTGFIDALFKAMLS